jgi:acyl dehydratase
MKAHFTQLAELQARVGQALGGSDWMLVDQARIDSFAQATGDHQWIHVDPVRAADGPFKTTVAHGFLTLSLLPAMFESGLQIDDTTMGVNYGLNRVRFPAPLPAGGRVRGHFKLLGYEPVTGGAQLTIEVSVELEGSATQTGLAEAVSRRYL